MPDESSSGAPAATAARPVVVVTRRLPAEVEAQIAERFDARLNERDVAMTAPQLARAMQTADALLCTLGDRIGAEVMGVADRRARMVASYGVGTDHIDLHAARAAGIVVTNTPGVLTNDTADIAIALMLMACRRLGEGERELRAGDWTGWRPTHLLGRTLTGRTLGIVGYGRIGQAVARRAALGLGMRILYHARREHSARDAETIAIGARRAESLEALLAASDVVSLHVPSTSDTRGMMSAARLALMPRGSVLVNTARGNVVDEAALAAALASGALGAAGLDVYAGEPAVHPALLALDNVVLLPHLGSATIETRTAMGERALANLVAFFDGTAIPDVVEAPATR